MESTYGDRTHETPPDYAVELARVIRDTFTRRQSGHTGVLGGTYAGDAVFYPADQDGKSASGIPEF